MNTAEEIDLDQEIKANQNRLLRLKQLAHSDVWDADDIAVYLKCDKGTVLNKHSRSKTFPRAVNAAGETHRKWNRDEVKAWIKRRG